MTIICIAEKPEVAKDIAEAILSDCKRISIGFQGTYKGDTWAVTSAFGHLLNLCEPEDYDEKYAVWTEDDLPMYFPNWSLAPCKEDYKQKRLYEIGRYLNACDRVVCAGDPDDEGQLLIDEIIDYYQFKGTAYRVFINDNLTENIRKEFENLKNNDDYRPLSRAASARRMADKCFGINETRLAGVRLNRKGLSIGRVQTPTLGLVIERDRLVEGHVKEKFYELSALLPSQISGGLLPFKMHPDKSYLKAADSKVIKDRTFVERIGNAIRGMQVPVATTEKEKITNPPLPYNLTQLQADMNKRYGYSMKQTLDITQELRAKKAITYNRSDSQYLKEEHYAEASRLFRTILNGTLPDKYGMDFSRKSACFNDSLVTAHHGIIPQAVNVDPEKLSAQEKNVYMAICERYAMQFLPPMRQMVSESRFDILMDGYTHSFIYKASTITDPGYTKYFGKDKDEDEQKEGKEYLPQGTFSSVIRDTKIEEKEIKPPARYKEGTLAKDMASVAKYVKDEKIREILKRKDEGKKGENGSIGTVATRGAIVETLLKRGFLAKKGKNIVSTELGREFYSLLPEDITKPDLTAKWWLIQEAIKEEKESDVNAIQKAVVKEFMKHKNTAYIGKELPSDTKQKEKASGIFQGNSITFNREWGGHMFTDEEVKALLEGKTITFQMQFARSNSYRVSGSLKKQTYKGHEFYGFMKDEAPPKEGYASGVWKNKKVSFKKEWGGHQFSEDEVTSLLNDETITFTFKTKSGEDKAVSGKLANQSYNGKKFVGFKPDFKKK